VKSALAGSKFFCATYNGISNRRLFQNHRKTLPISQAGPK
jgi:hypothetical protein